MYSSRRRSWGYCMSVIALETVNIISLGRRCELTSIAGNVTTCIIVGASQKLCLAQLRTRCRSRTPVILLRKHKCRFWTHPRKRGSRDERGCQQGVGGVRKHYWRWTGTETRLNVNTGTKYQERACHDSISSVNAWGWKGSQTAGD